MNTTGRILLSAALFAWSVPSLAQEQFNTPEEAVDALVGAAKTGDAKAILAVLGPDGQAIVSSGDPVADSNTREKFVSAYDAKHEIELEGNGTQTLVIGTTIGPSRSRSSTMEVNGSSTRRRGSMKSCGGASAATSSPPSRSLWLTSRRRTNMPRSIRQALGVVSMRRGS